MPIRRFAESGSVFVRFPASHSMSRWRSYSSATRMPTLGRFGDTVDVATLPESVRTLAVAEAFGAVAAARDARTEVCGSPYEVPNQPRLGHRFTTWLSAIDQGNEALFRSYSITNGKSMVHTALALYAPDQLRQRMAWALSQIYIIGVQGLSKSDENEIWHTFTRPGNKPSPSL